ncbi:MAG: DUF4252 domain-containing protein [Bryobacterales bacterium]|nr:DUF4252 domain-containing protein [Bryobacterales bacterium]
MKYAKIVTLALLLAVSALAQQSEFHNMVKFDRLAPKAKKTVEVNLDSTMLSFVQNFLSDSKKDEADAKRIIGKLKGIYVRVLEFDKEGEYNEADLDAIRKQVEGPGWQKMLDVREKGGGGDNAGVYMRTDGKQMQGLVVLAWEPKEVTIVNIVGTMDPADLRALSGKAGIPNINIGPLSTGKQKTKDKDDDEE